MNALARDLKTDTVTDAQAFGKVAVLMGGRSAEREVSLNSGKAVFEALTKRGVSAVAIDADADITAVIQRGDFDRVFIVLHGKGGEDGALQGALETMGIPFTGSGVLGSALAMDKVRTKQLWRGLGLPTPPFWVAERGDPKVDETNVCFPAIVKPVCQGSSIGMVKVEAVAQLKDAYTEALEYDERVIIEKWIAGAEYTASILCGNALPLIRLQTPRVFYDYDAKYHATDTLYHCPCGLSETSERELQGLALDAFNALGCDGWGRVDFMCDEQGQPWLLEANTVPGMTDHSLVPMAARQLGISFEQLCWRILETSMDE